MVSAHARARSLTYGEWERRIARIQQQLTLLRAQFHQASGAVAAAERALLARRAEREEIAVGLARLADVLESLEAAQAADRSTARTSMRGAG